MKILASLTDRIFVLFLSCFLILSAFAFSANAQEFTAANYYYNNFDDGTLGNRITHLIGAENMQVSSNAPIDGGFSLRSMQGTGVGKYKINALNNSLPFNLNDETYGWEWTLRYRTTDKNTDATNNVWKYWLVRENENANSPGCYLTQVGKSLNIIFVAANQALSSFEVINKLSDKKEYAIRLQRLKGGQWNVFVDADNAEAFTKKTLNISTSQNGGNIYSSSLLEVTSTGTDFVFDELKMYSMQILISGANAAANDIDNPLYTGQKDAIIYGLKVDARGLFDLNNLKVVLTGNAINILETPYKIYQSAGSYFGSGFQLNAAESLTNTQFSATGIDEVFYTVGNPDGTLKTASYYYITADVKAAPTLTSTFQFQTLTEFKSASGVNYALPTATPSAVFTVGNVYDWKGGTSTNWNILDNWDPKKVPTANDFARIGVVDFGNQPTLSGNSTVGRVLFGAKESSTLTIGLNNTLTVNSLVQSSNNKTATNIAGLGALDIKGNYLAESESQTTSTIASFKASNIIISKGKKFNETTTFNANGSETLVSNTISFNGFGQLNVGSLATLKLTGAQPFDFGTTTTNAVTLNPGSTVNYAAAVAQEVNTSLLTPYSNIEFEEAGVKNVATGNLNVAGNWNSEGGKVDLVTNNTTVSFTGAAAQNITDAGSDANNGVIFENVNFSGVGLKTLTGAGKFSLASTGTLTMGAGTELNANGKLTLLSTASSTATVAAIPSGAKITGNVNAQRFISGGTLINPYRTYRMLSSPVYDNANINSRTYNFKQFKDYMLVTGKGVGFDNTTGTNPASAWYYENGYQPLPQLDYAIKVGRGAYLFFRGDRSNNVVGKVKPTGPYPMPEDVKMVFTGELNQQNVEVPLTYSASVTGFNLLGNPYASSIDWNKMSKIGLDASNTLSIYNPVLRQYATYINGVPANGGSNIINSGQGFFVKSTAAGTYTFKESDKVTAPAPTLLLSLPSGNDLTLNGNAKLAFANTNTMQAVQQTQLSVWLYKEGTPYKVETVMVFEDGNSADYIVGEDAAYSKGSEVFMSSISQNNTDLVINFMPAVTSQTVVPLNVHSNNANGNYALELNYSNLPQSYLVKLNDKFLGTSAEIANGSTYSFTIDKSKVASFGANRFSISFDAPTTLPVVISAFNAVKVNTGVLVKWSTSSALNHSHFVVQRAGDDKVYLEVGSLPANKDGFYSLIDKTPLNGNNYYRLVQYDTDGKTTTTEPVVINYLLNNSAVAGVSVFPTLTTGKYTLTYNGALTSERYQLKITDITGKIVINTQVQKSGLITGYTGALPAVAAGVYFVELLDVEKGINLGVSKLIKQ